jgi:uncharacterized protein YkwD
LSALQYYALMLIVLWQPQDIDTFRQECLDAHNAYRAKHGAPPMTLDDDANASAQRSRIHRYLEFVVNFVVYALFSCMSI